MNHDIYFIGLPSAAGLPNAEYRAGNRETLVISSFVTRPLLAAIFCVGFGAAAFAENYQTDIGPTPLDTGTKLTVQGRGWVTASLTGTKFEVKGNFSGLVTPATEAALYFAPIMGGRAAATDPTIPLTVTKDKAGEVTGSATLTTAQVAALKKGRIYVQINSEKAPKGNLWGWFQPEHAKPLPNIPEVGYWYIPNVIDNYTPPTKNPGVS